MLLIRFNPKDGGSIRDRLRSLRSRARDLTPLALPVRQTLWEANRDRALRGVDYTGRPYAPLAPRTLADRRRKGYPPGPPLVRQGLQARVIAGCVVQVTPRAGQLRFLKSWPDVPWLEYHVTGTPRMPRRDPMGWSRAELDRVRTLLPRHVLGRPL